MTGLAHAGLAAMVMLLAACQDEPDFDERYEVAETKIREKAAEIDEALAKADRQPAAQEGVTRTPEEPASKQ